MRKKRILVVEDEAKTRETIRLYLERESYDVVEAADGAEGWRLATTEALDLVILDRMLPEVDGIALCQRLRRRSDVPVVMLTARSATEDRIEGLACGADDYVPKPFSPRELVLRVQAILRRTSDDAALAVVETGDLVIDPQAHDVRLAGAPVAVTASELRILHALARTPGRALTREELVQRAFGADYEGLERTVDVHIKNLRRKIERDRDHPQRIVTVFGVGYKFVG
ncbi:MAG TPA: response regulator transcription factor [Thermoanaerobaculia bacterium]|nr:response regulator transcription factor [Thermoanaerobaculia bacterium]